MKTLLVSIAIVVVCVVSPVSYADESSQKMIAEDLLRTMKIDETAKPVFNEIRLMMERQFVETGAPEEMRPVLNKYLNRLFSIIEQHLSWQNTKDDMISIYARSFTEDELKGMLEFYKSPAGQAVIDKTPAILQMTMAVTQKRMPEVRAQVNKIGNEMVEELKAEIDKKKPVSKKTPQSKDAVKLPTTREAKWPLLVGRWFGSTSTKEGGKYMWIGDKRNDGSDTIQFRLIDPSGKKDDKTEVGEWGVSGDVYFTIYKADVVGDREVPADATDPTNRDAYKMITLTDELFVYENLDNGVRFEAKKVPPTFTFPE